MPIGEVETHPYLHIGEIIGRSKLILGSFPVYECTNEDNDFKRAKRSSEGTIRFFYGSNRNSLWLKYQSYIDNGLSGPWNENQIINSLKQRDIAISDLILSCERYIYKTKETGEKVLDPYSSEDGALRAIKWNDKGLQKLITNGVVKILCTSKGVLSNLEKNIILKNGFGVTDTYLSGIKQGAFIEKIGGEQKNITKPIAKIFRVNGKLIEAIALPSPGSPQRQLKEFGFNGSDWRTYADLYFKNVFEWLVS